MKIQIALHAALLPLLRLEDGHLSYLPCVKGVQELLLVVSLELVKHDLLRPYWLGYWSLTRATTNGSHERKYRSPCGVKTPGIVKDV